MLDDIINMITWLVYNADSPNLKDSSNMAFFGIAYGPYWPQF